MFNSIFELYIFIIGFAVFLFIIALLWKIYEIMRRIDEQLKINQKENREILRSIKSAIEYSASSISSDLRRK